MDALWLQRTLADYGVAVDVRLETFESIRKPGVLEKVVCLLYGVIFDEDDVSLIELYEQTGSFLREHMDEALLAWTSGQIEAALGCKQAEDRSRYLSAIENRLRDETHVLFLQHSKQNTFYNPNIKGVGLNSLGWIDFKNNWLGEAEPLAGNAG